MSAFDDVVREAMQAGVEVTFVSGDDGEFRVEMRHADQALCDGFMDRLFAAAQGDGYETSDVTRTWEGAA